MKNVRRPFNVQERDLDLLILEQLHTNPVFVTWIANKLGVVDATFDDAMHSVYSDRGETDVLLFLQTPNGRMAVMIEDKIGAPMQPRQGERYHERGQALCSDGTATFYTTVLCAPEIYLRSAPDDTSWRHRLSIEEIIAWFSSDNSLIGKWRSAILSAASSKASRAHNADDKTNSEFDGVVLALKIAYREFVETHYPELLASVQAGRDREYYLKALSLPAGVRFKHSFFKGEISLIFEKKWTKVAEDRLRANAPDGSWLVKNGSELHLREAVEVMDPALPLEEQGATISEALDAICRLIPVAEQAVFLNVAGSNQHSEQA